MLLSGVIVASLFVGAFAAPAEDKITSLPGYDGKLPNMWSGYVSVGTHEMFYWVVEAETSPETKPVVVWNTGGPGCSGLFALFTEQGPLQMVDDKIVDNPYAWSKAATMVWVESPCGVGFSYDTAGNYKTGDNDTAEVMHGFISGLYEKFPEFDQRDLWLSGESYAGHYVPQAAHLLFNDPKFYPSRLKGWMVGNPSFDSTDGSGYFPLLTAHGVVSQELFREANETCGGNLIESKADPNCSTLVQEMRALAVGLNPYDLIAPCVGKPSLNGGCLTTSSFLSKEAPFQSQTFVPCINTTAVVTYLRRADVQQAIHASDKAFQWDVCSSHIEYDQYAPTVAPLYHEMLGKMRIVVYSGSSDSCVPFLSTEKSMDGLGYPNKTPWSQWHANKEGYGLQIAGFTKEYDVGTDSNKLDFHFVTVRASGHMVPHYTPESALSLFSRVINFEEIAN